MHKEGRSRKEDTSNTCSNIFVLFLYQHVSLDFHLVSVCSLKNPEETPSARPRSPKSKSKMLDAAQRHHRGVRGAEPPPHDAVSHSLWGVLTLPLPLPSRLRSPVLSPPRHVSVVAVIRLVHLFLPSVLTLHLVHHPKANASCFSSALL